MKKIKYGILQPLTGGVYFAAENVFSYPAEWILSYPGLEAIKYRKNKIFDMGNERHFLEYLKNKNKLPPYLQFNRSMFDDPNYDIDKTLEGITSNKEYYSKTKISNLYEMDLIASVPVCSGLSSANTFDYGKDDCIKNNNMKFLLKFVLKDLKPKVYIFENAPGLYTNKGKKVRDYLNKVAFENQYSVTYVKTDTKLHNNIQYRPRTFAIFWQWLNNKQMPPPDIGFENNRYDSLIEYLKLIPKDATQNTKEYLLNNLNENKEFQFISKIKNWREKVGNFRFKSWIIHNNLANEFYKFHKDEKLKSHYDYCQNKLNIHKGYYDRSFFVLNDKKCHTVYHGNTWWAIHPIEDRCLTFREYSHLMGMPHDWEYLHNRHSFGSIIGQNVPVKTFEFWINECKKVLEDWENKRKTYPEGIVSNIYFHNNLKEKESYYE